jgi:sigma-B regulation protein RsbU (phosphoserine phosphatase)
MNLQLDLCKLLTTEAPPDFLTDLMVLTFAQSDEAVKDGMDVALCALNGNTLQYARAKDPLWIVRNGELIETKANNHPIGQVYEPLPFTTHTFELQPSDTFYSFPDGYVDQFGGPKGKKFKASAFRALVLGMQDESMDEQRALMDQAIDEWQGDLEQIDDACVIGIRL